jgi:hypothetical protein
VGVGEFFLRPWRRLFSKRRARPDGERDASLRNWNEDFIREDFKRRYLTEFAGYVGRDMVASQTAAANFGLLLVTILGSAFSPPLGLVLSGGLVIRYLQIGRDAKRAIGEAAYEVTEALQSGAGGKLAGVERWLDQHCDELPTYLDKLDREAEDRHKQRALIERINREGSAKGVTADDRAFLAKRGIKKLNLPPAHHFALPPRVHLGNWHHSQLARALWKDMAHKSGARGKLLRRLVGVAGKAH